jgi:hypothetical protein
MTADTFFRVVMGELSRSPDVPRDSFFQARIRALGRLFERGKIDAAGVIAELERSLPWQLNRDIKKSIEKSLS